MHVVMRDHDGAVLGSRDVDGPADCAARAALAAVLIGAWTGDFIRTSLGRGGGSPAPTSPPASARVTAPPLLPAVPSPARPTSPSSPRAASDTASPPKPPPPAAVTEANPAPVVTVAPVPRSTPALTTEPSPRPWTAGADVGAVVFGIHDGDAGTYGAGVQAMVRLRWLRVVALAETTGERHRLLGPAEATYASTRFGVGAGVGAQWRRVFADFTLVPELARDVMHGSGAELSPANRVVAWGYLLDGRARVGWRWRAFAPFLFAGASWSFVRERLTLDNRPDAATSLSRGNLAAGLGFSVTLR
jgi:hypothetical protein